MVQAWNSLLGTPVLGGLLLTMLGGNSRIGYKIGGATEAPPLSDYWHPLQPGQGCKNGEPYKKESEADFPWVEHGVRGTPENTPFTDFSNAIFANERGNDADLCMNAGARGMRMRFKTGNSNQANAQTLFEIRREPPFTLCGAIWFITVGVFCWALGKICPCCGCGAEPVEAKDSFEVYGSDRKTRLGFVQQTKQLKTCELLFRNRFKKAALPVYDICDTEGTVVYTAMIPIKEYKFLGMCQAWSDEKHMVFIKGKRDMEDIYSGSNEPNLGWMVRLDPYHAKTIDHCLARCSGCMSCLSNITCGMIGIFMQAAKIFDKFIVFMRTCPIDNLTQVPNPGSAHLRKSNDLPCTHALRASRMKFPEGVSDQDRILLIALMIQADAECRLLTL